VLRVDVRPRRAALRNPKVLLIRIEIMNTKKKTYRNAQQLMP
jgi:hypothetical protein